MTIYILKTYIAFQSAVRQIKINYLLKAYVILILASNCHVFTVFDDSEDSPKWAFFIDAAVMLAL